jgi:hypothetical protein
VSLINSDRLTGQVATFLDEVKVSGSSQSRGASHQLSKWLVIPDPKNAPLTYPVVDKYTPVDGPGVIVPVEHDEAGCFYRYEGRRVSLPDDPCVSVDVRKYRET